jgi:competence ComEA-like helix-hairpin-helix protein
MRLRKHHGIALLTAIWIMVVLLILVGGIAAMTHSEAEVARNFGDLTRARWAARSGVRRAEVEVGQVAALPYTALADDQRLLTSPEGTGTPDEMTYQATVEDEAGKLNLNTATPEDLAVFFPPGVADTIVDWRDADSVPRAQGAEDDYYATLMPPYYCKNAPFTTVEELLLVRGVTREMLSAQVTEDGQTLEDLLTVSSTDDNTDMDGQPRLNIKTASSQELTSRCGDVLTSADIDAIIQRRTSSPFNTPADLLTVPNLAKNKVAQLYDRLTATTATARPGLVNINTAPLEVLASLTGMDDATAQAIIKQRDEQGPFTDVGQLLTLSSVSNSTFRQVADLLTTRSKTFRVRSTGQTADGIAHTVTCLLQVEGNGGEATTRTLYWRE